ncbi:MAG: dihydropteroate synthase, partial [Solirubrobacterales bacterium]
AAVLGVRAGASVVRVHDVAATSDALAVAAAIESGEWERGGRVRYGGQGESAGNDPTGGSPRTTT